MSRLNLLSLALMLLFLPGCQLGADQPLEPDRTTGFADLHEGHDHGDEGWVTTESGLRYKILREGAGDKPKSTDTVTVHYRGWLDNGKEFDSSYPRNTPTSFPLGNVIPGWTEGLTYVQEGGEIELEIPSELGYGQRGSIGIPPGSTLHFSVELLEIQ
ncbi:MAG: FKBP-type peptidyl-prolyl cis-trans isomerase [Planctomycetaceae bacterium]